MQRIKTYRKKQRNLAWTNAGFIFFGSKAQSIIHTCSLEEGLQITHKGETESSSAFIVSVGDSHSICRPHLSLSFFKNCLFSVKVSEHKQMSFPHS